MRKHLRLRPLSFALALAGTLVSPLILPAQTRVQPSSRIIAIDSRTGVVSAHVNTTGVAFQFTLNNPAVLGTLKIGQGVYANFQTKQVSLDGQHAAGTIVSLGTPKSASAASTIPSKTSGSVVAPQPDAVPRFSSTSATGGGGNLGLPALSSVMLNPASVTGGAPVTGTLNFTGAAPQGGIQVELLSSNASAAAVPQNIVVAAGATSAAFTVSTKPLPLVHAGKTSSDPPVPVVISASAATAAQRSGNSDGTYRVVTQTATLNVYPPVVESLGHDSSGPLQAASLTAPIAFFTCRESKSEFRQTGATPTRACVQLTGPAADEAQNSVTSSLTPMKIRGAGVALSSSNPLIAQVASVLIVPAGRQTEQFAINTVPVASHTSVEISAHRTQTDTQTLQLTVLPPVLQDLQCPARVTGGSDFHCTVTLNGPAYGPPNNPALTVTLKSCGYNASDPLATCAPLQLSTANLTFQTGAASAAFAIHTPPVATDLSSDVSATFAGATKQVPLTVLAPRPLAVIPSPSSVPGGTPWTGRVTLNGPAPQQGMYVTLKGDDLAIATVPVTVHVRAGGQPNAVSDPFTVQTKPVSQDTTVNITAAYDSTLPTASGSLTVKAPLKAALTVWNLFFYVNGQPVQVADLTGQPFRMCVDVRNAGQANSQATSLQIALTKSDGTTVQTWSASVPELDPNAATGPSNPCIDVPALETGYTYDFNGVFGGTNSPFFMLELGL